MCAEDDDKAVGLESQGENGGKRGGKKRKKRDDRDRVYAFIVYIDSAYPDWMERLAALHVCGYISPLHDQDVMADGTPKKPHYHVMLRFKGKKSVEQINAIREKAIGPDYNRAFEDLNEPAAYARYLIHLDSPQKAQYSRNDVVCLGGADYNMEIAMPGDDSVTLAEISAYISAEKITRLSVLIAICKSEKRHDWLSYISRKGYLVNALVNQETNRQIRVRSGLGVEGDFQ